MKISWSYHHHNPNASSSTNSQKSEIRTMKLNSRTSVLMIDSIGVEHLGFYTCSVKAGRASLSANYTAELKSVTGGYSLF